MISKSLIDGCADRDWNAADGIRGDSGGSRIALAFEARRECPSFPGTSKGDGTFGSRVVGGSRLLPAGFGGTGSSGRGAAVTGAADDEVAGGTGVEGPVVTILPSP